MTAIYRQYRPACFDEVTGQKHVTDTLQAAIAKNKLTHAYLFYGPRGTGKTTTARILAARLNCRRTETTEPCRQCESCRAMAEGRNIDVIEIDAASNRGIDDIRALRDRIGSAPSLSKYKVYIVDEAHMLTAEAASALLKTLEEPVRHAVFILATTELHKVLPTILSRCQVYRFKRASREEMLTRLKFLLDKEQRTAGEDVLDFIVDRSDGCYRDAESLLGQLLTLQGKRLKREPLQEMLGLPPDSVLEEFLKAMHKGESAGALLAVHTAFTGGHDPEQFLQESIRRARDKAVAALEGGRGEAARWTTIIRVLLQAKQDLDYVPQPLIALQLAILTVCTSRGEVPVKGEVSNSNRPIENSISSPAKRLPQRSSDWQMKPNGQTGREKQGARSVPATSNMRAPQLGTEKIAQLWPQLIEAVKKTNPVAATFLRAIEPIRAEQGRLDLRARYSLHRNFFSMSRNKAVVEEELGRLLGEKVATTYILDEAGQSNGVMASANGKTKEEQFYQTVKEVFG